MLEQFLQLQDRLLALMDGCETLLGSDARDVQGLAQLRWQFARALHEYESSLERIIEQAARFENDRTRAPLSLLRRPRVGAVFREHVMKWSAISIADHWEEYRGPCLQGLPRLRERLSEERAAAATLLEAKRRPDRLAEAAPLREEASL